MEMVDMEVELVMNMDKETGTKDERNRSTTSPAMMMISGEDDTVCFLMIMVITMNMIRRLWLLIMTPPGFSHSYPASPKRESLISQSPETDTIIIIVFVIIVCFC